MTSLSLLYDILLKRKVLTPRGKSNLPGHRGYRLRALTKISSRQSNNLLNPTDRFPLESSNYEGCWENARKYLFFWPVWPKTWYFLFDEVENGDKYGIQKDAVWWGESNENSPRFIYHHTTVYLNKTDYFITFFFLSCLDRDRTLMCA